MLVAEPLLGHATQQRLVGKSLDAVQHPVLGFSQPFDGKDHHDGHHQGQQGRIEGRGQSLGDFAQPLEQVFALGGGGCRRGAAISRGGRRRRRTGVAEAGVQAGHGGTDAQHRADETQQRDAPDERAEQAVTGIDAGGVQIGLLGQVLLDFGDAVSRFEVFQGAADASAENALAFGRRQPVQVPEKLINVRGSDLQADVQGDQLQFQLGVAELLLDRDVLQCQQRHSPADDHGNADLHRATAREQVGNEPSRSRFFHHHGPARLIDKTVALLVLLLNQFAPQRHKEAQVEHRGEDHSDRRAPPGGDARGAEAGIGFAAEAGRRRGMKGGKRLVTYGGLDFHQGFAARAAAFASDVLGGGSHPVVAVRTDDGDRGCHTSFSHGGNRG